MMIAFWNEYAPHKLNEMYWIKNSLDIRKIIDGIKAKKAKAAKAN